MSSLGNEEDHDDGRGINSSSPLLSEERLRSVENTKDIYTETRPFIYILFLTVIIGGLQLSWTAEFSNGTPFLLHLGMSKTLMSLVWIAGPLSGTIGQPIVGILSDESRLKFGRRRPFIIGGGVATIVSLLMLSWSKDIIAFLNGTDDVKSPEIKHKTIPFAVFFVYALDFSISAIQAAARAYIVDNVPTHQQQIANAWAARMTGIGNIIGYVLGSMELPKAFPFLGDSQFKVLSACASIALVVTVIPSCWYIGERDPNTDILVHHQSTEQEEQENVNKKSHSKFVQVWIDTYHAIRNLSPQTWLICKVQFFSWIGYFPMLFYTTTYVGEMYVRKQLDERPADSPPLSDDEWDLLWEDGTRKGTQALVVYSVTSLIANFLFPYIAEASYLSDQDMETMNNLKHNVRGDTMMGKISYYKELLLSKIQVKGLTVAKVWTYCHLLFILLMITTFWINNATAATIFVAMLGIVWACALWAPFTLISEEVSRIKVKKTKALQSEMSSNKRYLTYEHEAGVVLGVMNVFISSPQVISSLFSSLLFKIFSTSSNHDTSDGDSIGWVFRFGGVATLFAFYLSLFVKTPEALDKEDEQRAD